MDRNLFVLDANVDSKRIISQRANYRACQPLAKKRHPGDEILLYPYIPGERLRYISRNNVCQKVILHRDADL